jgi:hypothetical protein
MEQQDGLDYVPGLRDFWTARMTGEPLGFDQRQRLVLDALGLGLEQTLQFIFQNRPDFNQFSEWVTETASAPDPIRIERLRSALTGAPPPAPIARQLAEIQSMAPVLDADDLASWEATAGILADRRGSWCNAFSTRPSTRPGPRRESTRPLRNSGDTWTSGRPLTE